MGSKKLEAAETTAKEAKLQASNNFSSSMPERLEVAWAKQALKSFSLRLDTNENRCQAIESLTERLDKQESRCQVLERLAEVTNQDQVTDLENRVEGLSRREEELGTRLVDALIEERSLRCRQLDEEASKREQLQELLLQRVDEEQALRDLLLGRATNAREKLQDDILRRMDEELEKLRAKMAEEEKERKQSDFELSTTCERMRKQLRSGHSVSTQAS